MSESPRDLFRTVAGRFPTGVTVVTSLHPDGRPCGLTANSFTTVSLDPPLVLVCIDHGADSHDPIRTSAVFGVNVLGSADLPLAERFWKEEAATRFEGLDWSSRETGAPILESSIAWLDCRVVDHHTSGDHTIFIGRVEACDRREGDPLVFHDGAFHQGLG